MSDLPKKIHAYRQGDNWKQNFKYIVWDNVEASLRSILNKREDKKVYDRHGNHVASVKPARPISEDEKIFRIAVLMDTQIEAYINNLPRGDYVADLKEAKAFVGSNPPERFGKPM